MVDEEYKKVIMKKLEDLTIEELYELFPISIEDFSNEYKSMYVHKEKEVKDLLGDTIQRISHIGSTAIKDMPSKPIVDILVEVEETDLIQCVSKLEDDWILMGIRKEPYKASFNQGYLITGYADEVYHLHLVVAGNPDELYFRDMINDNPELFEEYLSLKLKLLSSCEGDRELYTSGKSDFVKRVLEEGKKAYNNRYNLRS